MDMNCSEIKKILKEYDIVNLEDLKYLLETTFHDCDDDIDISEKKYCKEAKCFLDDIPSCRKVLEIKKKFYPNEKLNAFTQRVYKLYLEQFENVNDAKGISSLENWVSCKICTGEKNQIIKDDKFFYTLCSSLEVKLNKKKLFDEQEISIKQFKKKLIPITKDNFIPKIDKDKQEESMTQDERDNLYDIVHVTRTQLKLYLSDNDRIEGSDEFKMNLALYAFERDLTEESLSLVESLSTSEEFKDNVEYLQLYAKLLSNLQRDDEAIEVLEKLIDKQKPSIDVESYNLLAASIKRRAFKEYENNNIRDKEFENSLLKAKDIYSSIFNINKDYYPAINIIYLQMMLANRNDEDTKELVKDLIDFWQSSNITNELNKNNWWACISDIEFLVLLTNYTEALEKLKKCMHNLNEEEINDFSISSTIRQIELYSNFYTDIKLKEFILKLKDINSKKHLSKYIKKI